MASAVMAFDPLNERDVASLLEESGPAGAPLLHCASCDLAITDPGSRTERAGSHDHHLENPLGITFHIGCFTSAQGCASTGGTTPEHSWFPGYSWQVAICRRCQRHLGWRFQSSTEQFFGLILSSLRPST